MGKKNDPTPGETLSMSESALDKVISIRVKSQPEPELPPPPGKMGRALWYFRDRPWYGIVSLFPVFIYGYFEYKEMQLNFEDKQLTIEERRADLEERSKKADQDRIEVDRDIQEKLRNGLQRIDALEADMEFTWRILDSGLLRMIGGNTAPTEDPHVTHTLDSGDMHTRPPPKKSKRPSQTGDIKIKKRNYGLRKPTPAFD